MQRLGYRVWFDRGLHGGDQYSDVIAGQIDACHCFLPLLSQHFLESDYCMDEIHYALEMKQSILPVYLENITLSGGLRMRLSRFHALWCSSPGFWQEIERTNVLKPCRKEFIPKKVSKFSMEDIPGIETALLHRANNILKADSKDLFYDGTWDVLGHELLREQVLSITFLDTTSNAPKNCWDVSEAGDGSVVAWATPNMTQTNFFDLYIAGDGGVIAPKDCDSLFSHYSSLTILYFGNNFDTSHVHCMESMFSCCSNLRTLDLGDKFDTSSVTTMFAMFSDCHSLSSLYLRNRFDTSNVMNMAAMFSDCPELKNLNVANWDLSSVTEYDGFMNEGQLLNDRPWEELFQNR